VCEPHESTHQCSCSKVSLGVFLERTRGIRHTQLFSDPAIANSSNVDSISGTVISFPSLVLYFNTLAIKSGLSLSPCAIRFLTFSLVNPKWSLAPFNKNGASGSRFKGAKGIVMGMEKIAPRLMVVQKRANQGCSFRVSVAWKDSPKVKSPIMSKVSQLNVLTMSTGRLL